MSGTRLNCANSLSSALGFELSLQSVDVLIKKQPVQVKVALFGIDTPREVSLVEPDSMESRGE